MLYSHSTQETEQVKEIAKSPKLPRDSWECKLLNISEEYVEMLIMNFNLLL